MNNPEWQPLAPQQLLSLFADSKEEMKQYLDQVKYKVVSKNQPFQIGDTVCYKTLMWGDVPGVVTHVREHEISCHLIGYSDISNGWQNIDNVQHIELL